jgi:hypothetical protein
MTERTDGLLAKLNREQDAKEQARKSFDYAMTWVGSSTQRTNALLEAIYYLLLEQ